MNLNKRLQLLEKQIKYTDGISSMEPETIISDDIGEPNIIIKFPSSNLLDGNPLLYRKLFNRMNPNLGMVIKQ
jgi:hypothetical protein